MNIEKGFGGGKNLLGGVLGRVVGSRDEGSDERESVVDLE